MKRNMKFGEDQNPPSPGKKKKKVGIYTLLLTYKLKIINFSSTSGANFILYDLKRTLS